MTLRRGLAILQVLRAADENGFSVGEIAQATGLHRATLHRILATLIDQGWVEREEFGRYHLGSEAWRLGQARNSVQDFVRLADPSLDKLQQETSATIFLVKRKGNEGMCVARRDGSIPVRIMIMDVGVSYPLGVAAGTIAILAHLPDKEQRQILNATKAKLAHFPRLSIAIIEQMINQTRECGYSFSQGLVVPGLHSVGVPIFDDGPHAIGSLAAVNLGELLKDRGLKEIATILQHEASRISQRISQRAEDRRDPARLPQMAIGK